MLCRMLVPTYNQTLGPTLLVQHTLLSLLRPEISSLMLLICLPLPELLQPQSLTELASYVDAAHATDLVTCRLITGLVIMFCDGPMAFNRTRFSRQSPPAQQKPNFLLSFMLPRLPSTFGRFCSSSDILNLAQSCLHSADSLMAFPSSIFHHCRVRHLMAPYSAP